MQEDDLRLSELINAASQLIAARFKPNLIPAGVTRYNRFGLTGEECRAGF